MSVCLAVRSDLKMWILSLLQPAWPQDPSHSITSLAGGRKMWWNVHSHPWWAQRAHKQAHLTCPTAPFSPVWGMAGGVHSMACQWLVAGLPGVVRWGFSPARIGARALAILVMAFQGLSSSRLQTRAQLSSCYKLSVIMFKAGGWKKKMIVLAKLTSALKTGW